jgi:transcriptional regulator with XRE-family HTH domain
MGKRRLRYNLGRHARFAKNLKHCRKTTGMSMAEAAAALSECGLQVTGNTVKLWEKARATRLSEPAASDCWLIAACYGCTIADLFDGG